MTSHAPSAALGASPLPRLGAVAPAAAAFALPVVVLLPLALGNGGYFPTAWGWGGLAASWLAVLALLLRGDLELSRLEAGFLVALGGFAAWTAASQSWTIAPARTPLEVERTILYLAGPMAAVFIARRVSASALAAGVWAAITLASSYGLLSVLFPDRVRLSDALPGGRLTEPLGYWNAVGVFASVGVVLAVGFSAYGRSALMRVAAAASVPPLVLTIYFTFSRGSFIALGVGVALAIVLDLPRLRVVSIFLALLLPTAVAVASAARSYDLNHESSSIANGARDGHRLALVALACALGSAAIAAGLAAVRRRNVFGPLVRRAYAASLVLLLVALGTAATVHYGSPATLAAKAYDEFSAPPPAANRDLNARLFQLSGTWRSTLWRVAADDVRAHPALGSGGGSYEQFYLRHRPSGLDVRDAHNLYLETLAEVGPVGLVSLLFALGLPLAAAVRMRRVRLMAPLAGAYVVYLVHAAADWDWEMPAITLAALFVGCSMLLLARPERSAMRAPRLRAAALTAGAALAAASFVGLVGNLSLSASADAAAKGNWREAEAQARRAMRWAPWSSAPWQQLGETQMMERKLPGARQALRIALRKDPQNWVLWYDLASVTSGRARASAFAEATRLNPRGQEIQQFQADFGGAVNRPGRAQ